ncbi:MAG: MotA/TolQ/ExbB proton channel family protein [Acidobacteriota bacterium]|nr:MotA/TolQ/ExbB proton channel family protein [Acidobacteriota bacterium]
MTTEFGLIVAIPSLLFHAYLSRRARRFVDGMEKTAISFVNRLSLASAGRDAAAAEQG